jgi:hypothetical protein
MPTNEAPVDALLPDRQLDRLLETGHLPVNGFLAPDEVSGLIAEVERLLRQAPADPGGTTDPDGNPIEHPEDYRFEPGPSGEPGFNRIWCPMWRSQRFLEAYGNPRIHRVGYQLYGERMVPFDESIVLQLPNHGTGFPWHQDGAFRTGTDLERGHNIGIYLTPSTEANGALRVLPGSHRQGILDLAAMVEEQGFELPGSTLLSAEPGDANIHSRSIAHGAKPNVSKDLRATWYVGFHLRDAIESVWDEAAIHDKLNLIPIAVEARKACGRYPREVPFPYERLGLEWPTSAADRERALRTPGLQV